GPWDNIGFNLINDADRSAYAIGGLYVLTQAYAGTPASLSSSTAGYLGFTNTINDGVWDFSGVTLEPDTPYFFYMDSVGPLGQAIDLVARGDPYPGGNTYAGGPGAYSSFPGADMLFVLTGDQVSSAPEPGTLEFMAGAAAMVAALRRRRARRA